MTVNRGKQFEDIIRACFEEVPNTHVKRLYDVQGGYLGIANECDFYVFRSPNLYLIECKSVHGNLLSIYGNDPKKKYGNISNTQWEGMLEATKHSRNVVAGVICWWVDKDVTKFIPIQLLQYLRDVKQMKSIRYDFIPLDVIYDDLTSNIVPIDGIKKRVFFDYDLESFLKKFEKST